MEEPDLKRMRPLIERLEQALFSPTSGDGSNSDSEEAGKRSFADVLAEIEGPCGRCQGDVASQLAGLL